MLLQATKVPRNEHIISRKAISKNALKVLYRLHESGYQAYLVGGGVRDLLMGLHPKDFDVVTDATPPEVRKLFSNCRLIGRRFRLAHVVFGREIIEVATFRGHHPEPNTHQHGQILDDNIFGTLEEDAARRDFTINNLYYNIADFSVLNFEHGLEDLKNRVIRIIGEPEKRYKEDPVRLLRAIRFAAKLSGTIEEHTAAPITELAPLLANVPSARLFEELLKLFHSGHAVNALMLLRHYQLFDILFPLMFKVSQKSDYVLKIAVRTLTNTDQRVASQLPVSPGFLFGALLWPVMQHYWEKYVKNQGVPKYLALQQAIQYVLSTQQKTITIPKRFSLMIREMWQLQWHMERRLPKKIVFILQHNKFRAAYDLLIIRSHFEASLSPLAEWWTEIQECSHEEQLKRISELKGKKK